MLRSQTIKCSILCLVLALAIVFFVKMSEGDFFSSTEATAVGLWVLSIWIMVFGSVMASGFGLAIAIAPENSTQKFSKIRKLLALLLVGLALISPFVVYELNERARKPLAPKSATLLQNVCEYKAKNEVSVVQDCQSSA
jgi:uncharacterized membrane protein